MRILVILPAKDESESLRALLPQLPKDDGLDYVMIDDHSMDGSEDIARSLGIEVISQPELISNKARAVKPGFQRALAEGYDAAIVFDTDGQHPVEALSRIVHLLADHHIVKGSRFLPDSSQIEVPLDRMALNVMIRSFMRAVTGWNITDPQCGLFGIRRGILEQIFPLIDFRSEWELQFELLYWHLLGGHEYGVAPCPCPFIEIRIPAIYGGLTEKQRLKYEADWQSRLYPRLEGQFAVIRQALQQFGMPMFISGNGVPV